MWPAQAAFLYRDKSDICPNKMPVCLVCRVVFLYLHNT